MKKGDKKGHRHQIFYRLGKTIGFDRHDQVDRVKIFLTRKTTIDNGFINSGNILGCAMARSRVSIKTSRFCR